MNRFLTVVLAAMFLVSFLVGEESGQKGEFAAINGAKLWYETEGKGEALLLIPGGPGFSHRYFRPHFKKLAEDIEVIYFDPLGRGRSSRAEDAKAYSIDRDVEDIEGMRKHLGFAKIHLFGHSYGGIVAQAYASKYPKRLGKLILANTFASAEMDQESIDSINTLFSITFPEVWEKMKIYKGRTDPEASAALGALVGPISMPFLYFNDPSNLGKFEGGQEEGFYNVAVNQQIAGLSGYWGPGGELARVDFRDALKALEVPCLIIASRHDRRFPAKVTTQYKEIMPQARFVMMEGSGHFPFIEENEAFSAAIKSFLLE